MKKHIFDLIKRGLCVCGFGPIVLAILYLILQHCGIIETLTVNEVCIGIFSLYALAFVAGGMNFIYQIERLPLMIAILIHGLVLYASYLATYLLNNWLEFGLIPVLIFSAIFVVGYFVIWAGIYAVIKRSTKKINKLLNQKQKCEETR